MVRIEQDWAVDQGAWGRKAVFRSYPRLLKSEWELRRRWGREYPAAYVFKNLNLYVEYIILNTKLDESQAGIKIARRNINNLMQMIPS